MCIPVYYTYFNLHRFLDCSLKTFCSCNCFLNGDYSGKLNIERRIYESFLPAKVSLPDCFPQEWLCYTSLYIAQVFVTQSKIQDVMLISTIDDAFSKKNHYLIPVVSQEHNKKKSNIIHLYIDNIYRVSTISLFLVLQFVDSYFI